MKALDKVKRVINLCGIIPIYACLLSSCTSEKEYAAEDFLQQYHRTDLIRANVHGVDLYFYKKDDDGCDIYKAEYVLSGTKIDAIGRSERVHDRRERMLKEISHHKFEIYYEWKK